VSDRSGQERLLAWLRPRSERLVKKLHPHVGSIVKKSLGNYSNDALVKLIDEKFGDDLQFVRFNGAVLGFLIGIILSSTLLAVSLLTQ
jgi:uncharacterized membrane-anchored protein YjiN (DUF445 family)